MPRLIRAVHLASVAVFAATSAAALLDRISATAAGWTLIGSGVVYAATGLWAWRSR